MKKVYRYELIIGMYIFSLKFKLRHFDTFVLPFLVCVYAMDQRFRRAATSRVLANEYTINLIDCILKNK